MNDIVCYIIACSMSPIGHDETANKNVKLMDIYSENAIIIIESYAGQVFLYDLRKVVFMQSLICYLNN